MATAVSLRSPHGVAVDTNGNVFFAELSSQRIRRISTSGILQTIVGSGITCYNGENIVATSAYMCSPYSLWIDSLGNLFWIETSTPRLKTYTASTGKVRTLIGNYGSGYAGDGLNIISSISSIKFNGEGVWGNSKGDLFIADGSNYRVRSIMNQIITTIAGTGSLSFAGDGGPVSLAYINSPAAVWGNTLGTIYFVDSLNYRIRAIDTSGITNTIGGNGDNGPFTADGVAFTSMGLNTLQAMSGDTNGNLYFFDNRRLRRFVVSSNTVQTLAGSGGCCYSNNLTATSSYFSSPRSIWVDPKGNVYIADTNNHRIRLYNKAANRVYDFAGNGTDRFTIDNVAATRSTLNNPYDVWGDMTGNIFITDRGNYRIRRVNANNIITTFAGNGINGYSGDGGPATSAKLNSPYSVSGDSTGVIYSGENNGCRIRMITSTADYTNPMISTIIGNGNCASSAIYNTLQTASQSISSPKKVWVDSVGSIYIVEQDRNWIRKGFYLTAPSSQPSIQPSSQPTAQPASRQTGQPSSQPSSQPTVQPSRQPTFQPTTQPATGQPSSQPAAKPNQPVSLPTGPPSSTPTGMPSCQQNVTPTNQPSSQPTTQPTEQPISTPTATVLQPSSTNYPSSILPSVATYSLMPSFNPNVRPSQIPTAASSVFYFTSSTNATDWKVSITLFGSFSFNQEAVSRLDPSGPSEGVSSIIFGSRALSSASMIDSSSPSSHYPVAQISPTYKRDATTRSAVIPGDMNGDRFNDLIVCYPLSSSCYIFFGSGEGGLRNVRIGVTIYGLTGSYLGFAVSGAEDVNEDGYADVIISALSGKGCYVIYGRSQSSWQSEMRVSEMRSGGRISEGADGYKILTDASTTLTGLSVAGLGDMNGDGRGDLAISVQRGASYIVYVIWGEGREGGKDVSLSEVGNGVKGFKVFGEEGYYTGLSISRVGDVNEDGLADLVIGAIPYPGRGKSPVQKSYLILGSSSSAMMSDMMLGEGMVGKGVVMLVGGGLIVSGPGDVNNDGIEDIMISDVRDYVSKGNAYMISYPGKMSSPPSFLPSSLPSSPPSNRPSSEPSSSPPTTSPSIGSFNSSFPPSITSNSSMYPSLKPSARVRPTRSPSHRPSNQPISHVPSALPTILATRAPSYRPTTIRTKQPNLTLPPSRAPTRFPITRPSPIAAGSPSPSPSSLRLASTEYQVRVVNATTSNKQGIIPGREGSNEIFEISSMSKDGKRRSGWSGTIIGGRGRKIYRIYPKDPSQPVNRIVLQDFDSSKDVIDLSHISKVGSKADLTYLTHPLTLFLPDNQKIILSSYDLMTSIKENNLVFESSSSSSGDSSSPSNTSVHDWFLSLAFIVPIVLTICCLSVSHLSRDDNDVTKKKTVDEGEVDDMDLNQITSDMTHMHVEDPGQAPDHSHRIEVGVDADGVSSHSTNSDDNSECGFDHFSIYSLDSSISGFSNEIDEENQKVTPIDEILTVYEDASLLLSVGEELTYSSQSVEAMFEDMDIEHHINEERSL